MKDDFLGTPVSWVGVELLVGGCQEDGKSFIPVSGIGRFELADLSVNSIALLPSHPSCPFCLAC